MNKIKTTAKVKTLDRSIHLDATWSQHWLHLQIKHTSLAPAPYDEWCPAGTICAATPQKELRKSLRNVSKSLTSQLGLRIPRIQIWLSINNRCWSMNATHQGALLPSEGLTMSETMFGTTLWVKEHPHQCLGQGVLTRTLDHSHLL